MDKENELEKKGGVTEDPVESDVGKRILFALRRIIRAVDIHSRVLATEYSITGPQLAYLLAVVEKGSLTATEIADRISLSASTVIGVLDRLEGKGFLKRDRDKKDRRLVHVTATDTGLELAASMPYPLKRPLNTALSKMSDSEQERITEALESLVKYMGAGALSADPLLEIEKIQKDMVEDKTS